MIGQDKWEWLAINLDIVFGYDVVCFFSGGNVREYCCTGDGCKNHVRTSSDQPERTYRSSVDPPKPSPSTVVDPPDVCVTMPVDLTQFISWQVEIIIIIIIIIINLIQSISTLRNTKQTLSDKRAQNGKPPGTPWLHGNPTGNPALKKIQSKSASCPCRSYGATTRGLRFGFGSNFFRTPKVMSCGTFFFSTTCPNRGCEKPRNYYSNSVDNQIKSKFL